jgi:hypothetical protein
MDWDKTRAGLIVPPGFRGRHVRPAGNDAWEKLVHGGGLDGATMMPFAQYSEQAILNAMFGNCLGMIKTGISAAATAQTSITAGTFASGGATTTWDSATPSGTTLFFVGKPGTGATQNQYTNPHLFAATSVTASPAAFTIPSQSIGLIITAGDIILNMGTLAAPAPGFFNNTLYVGLSTQAVAGATQANVLSGEPTSTGSYARVVLANNLLTWNAATAAQPSVTTNLAVVTFAASTSSGWSTGATNLVQAFISDAPTLAGGNVLAYGALGTPQSVNAAGITMSFAAAAFSVTLT